MPDAPNVQTVSPYIGIVFSLKEELRPFLRLCPLPPDPASHAPQMFSGSIPGVRLPVVATACGTGAMAAEEAVRALHAHPSGPPSALVICGFCGGLATNLAPSDLVLADRVVTRSGSSYHPDTVLLAKAATLSIGGKRPAKGTLFTCERVLVTPAEKQHARKQTDASIVDMETAGAAGAADALQIPWIAVRVLTDGALDAMPLDFNLLADFQGNVIPGRVLAAVAAQPWKIPALIKLGMRSSRAAADLAVYLRALLASLADEKSV